MIGNMTKNKKEAEAVAETKTCQFCNAFSGITPNMRFCPNCGSRIWGPCPACESNLSPQWHQFCASCGKDFTKTDESAETDEE